MGLKGLFGAVLDTIEGKYVDDATGVPRIIIDIVTQLEASGLGTKSIFHAAGNVGNIKRLQKLYQEAKYEEIEVFQEPTHDLCSLLVYYLQRLPEPLCTLLLYSDFLDTHRMY